MFQSKRIIQELELIMCDPIPNVTFWIDPSNLKIWHFIITGLASPYTGGEYICRIEIGDNYPQMPPRFTMETPNGRFVPGKNMCINNFDSHPEQWNPKWTISSLIQAFICFFMSTCHRGHNVGNNIIAVKAEKLAFAQKSHHHNLRNHLWLLDKVKTNAEITIQISS